MKISKQWQQENNKKMKIIITAYHIETNSFFQKLEHHIGNTKISLGFFLKNLFKHYLDHSYQTNMHHSWFSIYSNLVKLNLIAPTNINQHMRAIHNRYNRNNNNKKRLIISLIFKQKSTKAI